MREERKLNLKLVVTARFQWRFESSSRHQLDTRTTAGTRCLRAAVAQLAEADRDQSQTIAPDSAFATDRRIDRTQAPGVEMPVQVRPAQLDVRWSKGRTRRHHTDLGSQACRRAAWVASQGPGAGYALGPAPFPVPGRAVPLVIAFIENLGFLGIVTLRKCPRLLFPMIAIYRGDDPEMTPR